MAFVDINVFDENSDMECFDESKVLSVLILLDKSNEFMYYINVFLYLIKALISNC